MSRYLAELRVRDLGVIEDVVVPLAPGMTALSGETGAGKTLLVEALSLLLGGRADPSMVRAGASEALIEGRFVARGDDLGEDMVLSRAVPRAGRSRAWIDGRMASLSMLAECASGLVELHGQHQHRTLVHVDSQRAALDAYGNIDLTALAVARRRLTGLEHESASLGGDAGERAREVELLRYQLDEIEDARIEDGAEDERLEDEEDRLAAASSHREAASAALAALAGPDDDGALDRLATASASLAGRAPLAAVEGRVRSAMAELTDLIGELRVVEETWEDDPRRLDEVRTRRNLLHLLTRKFGSILGDVITAAEGIRARLAVIEAEEHRARLLDDQIRAARLVLEQAEAAVALARRGAAPGLATKIESTLHELAMPSARFEVVVEGDGPADRVSFALGANAGEPLQPLARTASGGELSRTMLAIRLALTDAPGVLVFDEVDAGVGGAAAAAVGHALAALGLSAQVLVVTHLAQVAAQADHQIGVTKSEEGGRTRSEVTVLTGEDRVVELSRMLSGRPGSGSARLHARELLQGAGSGPQP